MFKNKSRTEVALYEIPCAVLFIDTYCYLAVILELIPVTAVCSPEHC